MDNLNHPQGSEEPTFEKKDVNADRIAAIENARSEVDIDLKPLPTHEVFQDTEDGVTFRNVSWQRATVIFLKIQFAMSILSVPGSLATLGAVGGSIGIVGWFSLNTCE